VRAIRRGWGKLRLDWRVGLLRLPFFTQRTAVLLLGVLVATLALLGGVVALIGSPWSAGPTHLVPGGQAGEQPSPRPATGDRASGPAGAAGAAAGPGAPSAAPDPAAAAGPAAGARVGGGREAAGSQEPGGTATGARGSGGAAGAGAGGPPAAPPTTSPPTTTPNGPLPPLDDLLGPVVSTLLP
jgi:hypothetical protein